MSRRQLHKDWTTLGTPVANDVVLDIAAGTVRLFDDDTKRFRTYRLDRVYHQLVQKAYEDGRADRLPYVRV